MVEPQLNKQILSKRFKKAIQYLPKQSERSLAKLMYIHNIHPDELKEAGVSPTILFPLYY